MQLPAAVLSQEANISPISPLYIFPTPPPVSPLYLPCVSPVSPLYLPCISRRRAPAVDGHPFGSHAARGGGEAAPTLSLSLTLTSTLP